MPVDLSKIVVGAIYSVPECALLLGLSPQSIRSYLNSGSLPGIKSGNGRWKVKGTHLRTFAEGGKPRAPRKASAKKRNR